MIFERLGIFGLTLFFAKACAETRDAPGKRVRSKVIHEPNVEVSSRAVMLGASVERQAVGLR